MLVFILRNTHTQTDQAARKKRQKRQKKNLAAEHRAVRQKERGKNTMIHALIKTTRTTAFALRRHTCTHTTAEVIEVGREDWCENYVHTIPIHNDTTITRTYTYTNTHTYTYIHT